MRQLLRISLILIACALAGCAGMQRSEPLQVTVAGIESLPGEGLEMRMLVKLRVQNPNDAPLEYDGVFVKVDVLDKTFATGVSGERGTVPRYGETLIEVPVTVSALRAAFNVLGVVARGGMPEKVNYKLEGKLDGVGFGSTRLQAQGELTVPSR